MMENATIITYFALRLKLLVFKYDLNGISTFITLFYSCEKLSVARNKFLIELKKERMVSN